MSVFSIVSTPCSTCMLLVVSGKQQYSDSLTSSYRNLAMQLRDGEDYQLGYVDETTQYKFLEPFRVSLSTGLVRCQNDVASRPVSTASHTCMCPGYGRCSYPVSYVCIAEQYLTSEQYHNCGEYLYANPELWYMYIHVMVHQ